MPQMVRKLKFKFKESALHMARKARSEGMLGVRVMKRKDMLGRERYTVEYDDPRSRKEKLGHHTKDLGMKAWKGAKVTARHGRKGAKKLDRFIRKNGVHNKAFP